MPPLILTHGGALSNLALFLAIDTDVFGALGLVVSAPPLHGFGATASRLRDGTATIGTTGFTQALADSDSADPLVIVAGSGLRGMALIGARGQEVAALAGATVGTFADDPMQVLLADILARHNLGGRVTIRFMDSLAAAAAALESGEVAALTTVEPWISLLRRRGFAVLSDGSDVWGEEYPDTVLVTRRSVLEANPGQVIGVIRAMLRAEGAIRQDPGEALRAVAQRFPGFSPDQLREGLAGQPACIDLRGLEATILDRWGTVRRLEGKPSGPVPADLISFDCLAAAIAAEQHPASLVSPPERNRHV